MPKIIIALLLLLVIACDPAPKAKQSSSQTDSNFVLNNGERGSTVGKDSLIMLASTVGNPLVIKDGKVEFIAGESLFEIPLDSAKAWIKRPSFFRNPETKLADYLKGDAPAVFTYTIYNPFPGTSVDSVELDSYELNFRSSDLSERGIERGHVSLRLRNQHTKPIIALEFLVNVKRRPSKRGNCRIEPYTKTVQVNHNIPPYSQSSFVHSDKALGVKMECGEAMRNEVPYTADFKLMRYQIEGDTSWVDATVRRVIGK